MPESNLRNDADRTTADLRSRARQLLPLSATDFHLLLALSHQELYGYSLLQSMDDDSAGAVKPDIGSLYRTLHRLLRDELVSEAGERVPERAPGKPRRYYRITSLGRCALTTELERMRRAVHLAGQRGLSLNEEGALS